MDSRLQLENGGLSWEAQGADGEKVWNSEPRAGFWLRLEVWFFSLLPIEHLL